MKEEAAGERRDTCPLRRYRVAVPPITDAVVALVADFRSHAATLVDALRAQGGTAPTHEGDLWEYYDEDGEWVEHVTALGRVWCVWLHDPHGRFTAQGDGTVVEAGLYRPDLLDAGFLLTFAQTSGRHPAVLARCGADGYSTMCDLLDATVPGWDRSGVGRS